MSSRVIGTTVRQLGHVLSATGLVVRATAEPARALRGGGAAVPAPAPAHVWMLSLPLARGASTLSAPMAVGGQEEAAATKQTDTAKVAAAQQKAVVSYWDVAPARVTNEGGSEWRWACFRPWEAYEADLSIDLKKHHAPTTFLDKMAFRTVKALRWPTDIFFQRRYACRAMMLETVAAVPGMVGGMLLHLKSHYKKT